MIWNILDWLAKQTKNTDFDDALVEDLERFFKSHPALRTNIFSVLWRGVQNGFDLKDEIWTEELLALVFQILKAKIQNPEAFASGLRN